MRVGFTGTRIGMTKFQKDSFKKLIKKINPNSFSHGDCIGSDAEAHDIVKELCNFTKIFIHPPKIKNKRAYKNGSFLFEEKDYLRRNKDIVDSTDILIAIPKSNKEELISGTWSTVRYARKKGKIVIIIGVLNE